jgi:hypothetical protein
MAVKNKLAMFVPGKRMINVTKMSKKWLLAKMAWHQNEGGGAVMLQHQK